MSDRHDVAGVIAPPPVIYGAGIATGLVLNRLLPLPWLPRGSNRPIGALVAAVGGIPAIWALVEMLRAGTSPVPEVPTTELVTGGPFRWTRNPMYLSFTALTVSVAAWANVLWVLLTLPFVLPIMVRGVIEREERYLERTFGDRYRAYMARTRRWL